MVATDVKHAHNTLTFFHAGRVPRVLRRASLCRGCRQGTQLIQSLPVTCWNGQSIRIFMETSSDADQDPLVFGPSGSVSQRYGSGSFYHQAKIVRKPLTYCIVTSLWLFIFVKCCTCTYLQKVKNKKVFVYILKVTEETVRGADPDPYQNVMDSQHCESWIRYYQLTWLTLSPVYKLW